MGNLITLAPGYIRANDVYVPVDDGGEIIRFYALTRHGHLFEMDHLWAIAEWIGTGARVQCSPTRSSVPRPARHRAWAMCRADRAATHPPAARMVSPTARGAGTIVR